MIYTLHEGQDSVASAGGAGNLHYEAQDPHEPLPKSIFAFDIVWTIIISAIRRHEPLLHVHEPRHWGTRNWLPVRVKLMF